MAEAHHSYDELIKLCTDHGVKFSAATAMIKFLTDFGFSFEQALDEVYVTLLKVIGKE